jgi:hypothetical protein
MEDVEVQTLIHSEDEPIAIIKSIRAYSHIDGTSDCLSTAAYNDQSSSRKSKRANVWVKKGEVFTAVTDKPRTQRRTKRTRYEILLAEDEPRYDKSVQRWRKKRSVVDVTTD